MNPLTRTRAVEIARAAALAQGMAEFATGPSYLPRTKEQAEQFEPHDWVLRAMRIAREMAEDPEPIEAPADDAALYEVLNRPASPGAAEAAVVSFLDEITALRVKHGIPDVCVIVQARTYAQTPGDAPRSVTTQRYWGDVGANELSLLARWYGAAKQAHEDRLGDSIEAGRRMARDRRSAR